MLQQQIMQELQNIPDDFDDLPENEFRSWE